MPAESYYAKHRERIKEYQMAYYWEHRERIARYNKDYYQRHREELLRKNREHFQRYCERHGLRRRTPLLQQTAKPGITSAIAVRRGVLLELCDSPTCSHGSTCCNTLPCCAA